LRLESKLFQLKSNAANPKRFESLRAASDSFPVCGWAGLQAQWIYEPRTLPLYLPIAMTL
jgi:hypothetical protein